MRVSLRLGGLGWKLSLSEPSFFNSQKFAAYLADADGPELTATLDETLASDPERDPTVKLAAGLVRFEGAGARWESDETMDLVQARVGPDSLCLERAITAWVCSRVVRDGGLMMHAGAVRSSRGAILLLGRSGAGKSTASKLAGERRLCTNTVVLRRSSGGWQVYTTPFTGPVDPYPTEAGPVPLAGAMVLEKAKEAVFPQPYGGSAIAALAGAAVAQYPSTKQYAGKLLESLQSLAAECPVQRLPFRIDSIALPD